MTERRTARPEPCRWCGAKTDVVVEMGGVGWRVICTAPIYQPNPCRATGPIRPDPLTAIAAWNNIMSQVAVVA